MPQTAKSQRSEYRGNAAKSGPSMADVARRTPPIEIVNTMFPSYNVVKEAGGSFKVKIGSGQFIWISGEKFCLLNEPKNKQFNGAGGIDAYCVFAGMDKKSSQNVSEAIRAILSQFHPSLVDGSIAKEERAKRLAAIKPPESKPSTPSRPKNVDLPPRVTGENDVAVVRDYLVNKRKLSPTLIDDAMAVGAIYGARRDPNVEKKHSGTPVTHFGVQASRYPLNIIFALLDHSDNKSIAYAKRGVGGDFKLNLGPKSLVGFRVGPFSSEAQAVMLTESPIEALSRRTILEQTDPEVAKKVCIMGMCGAANPRLVLEEAKKRGITHVIAGFNNDITGRKYNEQTLDAAKELGMPGAVDMPPGEIQLSVYQRDPCIKAATPLLEYLDANKLPKKEIPGGDESWKHYQFPNTKEVCKLLSEIKQQEIGYHTIHGAKDTALDAARDQLLEKLKETGAQFRYKPEQDGSWKLNITNSKPVKDMVCGWVNKQQKVPPCSVDPKKMEHEFVELLKEEYVNKDWNEVCKGSPGRIFMTDYEPGLKPQEFLPSQKKEVASPLQPPAKPALPRTAVDGPDIGI